MMAMVFRWWRWRLLLFIGPLEVCALWNRRATFEAEALVDRDMCVSLIRYFIYTNIWIYAMIWYGLSYVALMTIFQNELVGNLMCSWASWAFVIEFNLMMDLFRSQWRCCSYFVYCFVVFTSVNFQWQRRDTDLCPDHGPNFREFRSGVAARHRHIANETVQVLVMVHWHTLHSILRT